MRRKMGEMFQREISVTGIVTRRSKTHSRSRGTVHTYCLNAVTTSAGELLADHVWIRQTPEIKEMEVFVGDAIQLDATVEQYIKGHTTRFCHMKPDYCLSNVHNVKVLVRGEHHE